MVCTCRVGRRVAARGPFDASYEVSWDLDRRGHGDRLRLGTSLRDGTPDQQQGLPRLSCKLVYSWGSVDYAYARAKLVELQEAAMEQDDAIVTVFHLCSADKERKKDARHRLKAAVAVAEEVLKRIDPRMARALLQVTDARMFVDIAARGIGLIDARQELGREARASWPKPHRQLVASCRLARRGPALGPRSLQQRPRNGRPGRRRDDRGQGRASRTRWDTARS
jgi:hypothetical protein